MMFVCSILHARRASDRQNTEFDALSVHSENGFICSDAMIYGRVYPTHEETADIIHTNMWRIYRTIHRDLELERVVFTHKFPFSYGSCECRGCNVAMKAHNQMAEWRDSEAQRELGNL